MRQWKQENRFELKTVHKMWLTFWMMVFDLIIATLMIGDYVLGLNDDTTFLLLGIFLVVVAFMLGRTSYHNYQELTLKRF